MQEPTQPGQYKQNNIDEWPLPIEFSTLGLYANVQISGVSNVDSPVGDPDRYIMPAPIIYSASFSKLDDAGHWIGDKSNLLVRWLNASYKEIRNINFMQISVGI